MRKLVLLLMLFGFSFSFAQENYKYIIVPKKFSFFKEENKYNLNVMTKTFFEKEGFEVYFDTDEFPKDLAENRCLALIVNPTENNSMFSTKITIELKDCYNKITYTSEEGTSKQKEFQKGYTEAFREALSSMKGKLNIKKSVVNSNDPEVVKPVVAEVKKATEKLSAIPTESGYNLVNEQSETIINLQKTSNSNIFTATKGTLSGILIKKNSGWFFEYYEGEKLISEKIDVKF